MRAKIFTFIFLLTFGVVAYYAFPIVKNRYFNSTPTPSEESTESTLNDAQPNPDSASDSPSSTTTPADETVPVSLEESLSGKTVPADPNATINFNERGTPDSQNLAHITTEHCNNNCDAFAMDFKLLEYCQQVCGIVPVKETSNCDDKKGIEKDYCLKDLAVTKKDSKLCNDIQDANLKLTCQNRILEDALESQTKSNTLDF